MLEIQSLEKSFGPVVAVDQVSMRIPDGQMVGIIGRSGAGKSTLLRLINRLAEPTSGQILFAGDDVSALRGRELMAWRARCAMIFQQFNLVNRLGLLTNVVIGVLGRIPTWRGTLGLFTRSEKLLAMEALARVGMDQYAGQRASTLSGGQQQRAAIARALVQQAEVLLADEPIASLDPESARRVMDALATINREDGITVVVSLHQVAYAKKYCPRTIALRDGKVVFDGPSERLNTEFLRELYGADSEELIMDETMSVPEIAAPATRKPTAPVTSAQPKPGYAPQTVPAYAAE